MTKRQRRAITAMLRMANQTGSAAAPTAPAERRAVFAALMAGMPVPEGVRTEDTTLGGRPALLVEPTVSDGGEHGLPSGTVLYFHGGSWSVGSPATALGTTASLVTRSGLRALSLDYRLAPEHPFPAAIEDGVAAYRQLLDEGTTPTSVVFAGDSAGGGLAVTVALAARDAGLPVPAAIVAFSPALDATRTGASVLERAHADPFLTPESLAETMEWYLQGQRADQDLASPAVQGNLSGLPPLLLQVGTNDVVLDDSTRMAMRAVRAGVDVVLDVTAGVPHVFQSFIGTLDEADQALDRAALWMTQHVV